MNPASSLHPLSTKIPQMSPLMGLLKIDQLAFLARTDQDEFNIKRTLRLDEAEWVHDEVVAKGFVRGQNGQDVSNTAKLLFNYDLGIEVEILRYLDGPNYPDVGHIAGGHLCHIGMHIERGERIPDAMQNFVFHAAMIQRVETQEHTNEFLRRTGRRYRYTIYDTKSMLGTYLKVIERLEADNA